MAEVADGCGEKREHGGSRRMVGAAAAGPQGRAVAGAAVAAEQEVEGLDVGADVGGQRLVVERDPCALFEGVVKGQVHTASWLGGWAADARSRAGSGGCAGPQGGPAPVGGGGVSPR
ncbi:hypothetical protein ACU686_26625 [Yinghuangia aomiensis]